MSKSKRCCYNYKNKNKCKYTCGFKFYDTNDEKWNEYYTNKCKEIPKNNIYI